MHELEEKCGKLLGRIEALERWKLESLSAGAAAAGSSSSSSSTTTTGRGAGGAAGECEDGQRQPGTPLGAARRSSHGSGGAPGGDGGGASGGQRLAADGGSGDVAGEDSGLQKILGQVGLRSVAARLCEETGVTSVSDLALLQIEDVQVRLLLCGRRRGAWCLLFRGCVCAGGGRKHAASCCMMVMPIVAW